MPGRTPEFAEFLGVSNTFADLGSAGAGTTTPDLANGTIQKITCSAATRTIAAPVFNGGAVGANVPNGTKFAMHVANASGGGLTLTWNAIFKTPSGTGAADTKYRCYEFYWDGAAWRTLSDSGDQTT